MLSVWCTASGTADRKTYKEHQYPCTISKETQMGGVEDGKCVQNMSAECNAPANYAGRHPGSVMMVKG